MGVDWAKSRVASGGWCGCNPIRKAEGCFFYDGVAL